MVAELHDTQFDGQAVTVADLIAGAERQGLGLVERAPGGSGVCAFQRR